MATPPYRQWILLRGLTRESAHWGGFATGLQQAMPADRVLALDLPGNGQFHTRTSPLSVRGMVQACRQELAFLSVAPPYHLLAMSLGAMVAAEWARIAPDELAGCVLVNTSMRPFSPFYQRLRPRNWAGLLQLARQWHVAGAQEAMERIILRMTSHRAAEHQSVVAPWALVRSQRPVSARNALRQLWAAARYRASAVVSAVPTLLLGSSQDQLVASQCSHALARAWGCPLRLHPFAGHDLPLDDPQWVIDEVLRWVSGVPTELLASSNPSHRGD